MKNKISTGLFLLAALWGAPNAAPSGASQTLLCASTSVNECLPIRGCRQVIPEAIAAPIFMRVDLAAKTITAVRMGADGKSTPIERAETVDGKLILQGAEDGVEGVSDGLGWTIAISSATGRMVLTAAGDDAAFTIFGACNTL